MSNSYLNYQMKTDAEKQSELQKKYDDLSDEILVLNVGGYIGESTTSEIVHAHLCGVLVKYLEEGKTNEFRHIPA